MTNRSKTAIEFAASVERSLRSSRTKDRSVATPTDGALEKRAALLSEVEARAALSGRFQPESVLSPGLDKAQQIALLSGLASLCVIHTDKSSTRWLMKVKERARVLRQLINDDQLQTRLTGWLPTTDRFGEILREMLKTRSAPDLDSLSHADLLVTASAWEVLSGMNLVQLDESKLQRLISQAEFLADYDVLLQDGFLGREELLKSLHDFLTRDTKTKLQTSRQSMVLTGLGGAGKSTLLAKFAREVIHLGTATLVILDFDRPAIDPGDTYWLEMEIARQVGRQYPELEEDLRRGRQSTRQFKGGANQNIAAFSSEQASLERGYRAVLGSVRAALRNLPGPERPILLVLDTFEEVAQRGLIDRIVTWLQEIVEWLTPIPMKVIFSGRLFDNALKRLEQHGVEQVLNVDELEAADAERLLKKLDVPEPLAHRLARSNVLPQRPLELKLLARLTKSDGGISIDTLEEEIRNGGPSASELFTGLVYRRVLLRVSDEARSLAFPGLVLRYLTKELIQNVLVPALNLPPMDEASAAKALDALASYEWLAYRQGEAVWHRKDLRRSILKAMIAKERDNAKSIHVRAAEYFSEKSDDRSRAEALYHRLMLAESAGALDKFERDELANAHEYIGGDIVDFPPAAQATLSFVAGMDVSVDEVPLLPPKYRNGVYGNLGKRYTDEREFGHALRLMRVARLPGAPVLSWERETLFATGSWDELVKWPPKLDPAGFRRLTYAFYPAALIAPEVLDSVSRERLLVETRPHSLFDLPSADGATLLERFSLGVVLANDDRSLGPNEHDALRNLASVIEKDVMRWHASASLQSRFTLLDLICGRANQGTWVTLSPFNVRLDPRWLWSVSQIAKRVPDSAARSSLESLVEHVRLALASSGNASARALLGAASAVTARYAHRAETRLSLAGLHATDAIELLQGPTPEFRDPCRFALLNAFSGPDDHAVLSGIFARAFPLPVSDVQTEAFQGTVAIDPEHGLEAFVELADRCGTLHHVMQLACQFKPQSKQLADVATAHERWRTAVRRLLTTHFNKEN